MRIAVLILFLFLAFSCRRVKQAKDISSAEIKYFKSLRLLDDNETVYQLCAGYNYKESGTFYTNKRIVGYWIGKRQNPSSIDFALYKNIKSITAVYKAGLTYSPYMLITTNDGKQLKFYGEADSIQLKHFFESAIRKWKENK